MIEMAIDHRSLRDPGLVVALKELEETMKSTMKETVSCCWGLELEARMFRVRFGPLLQIQGWVRVCEAGC